MVINSLELREQSKGKLGPMLTVKLSSNEIRGLAEEEIPVIIQFEDKATANKTFNQLQSASERSTMETRAMALESLVERPVSKPRSIFRAASLVDAEPHPNENQIRFLSLSDFSTIFEIETAINAIETIPGPLKQLEIDSSNRGVTTARNLKSVESISVFLPQSTVLALSSRNNPKSDDIKVIDLDFEVKTFMEQTESYLGVPSLWNREPKLTGEGIVVGVLDTGIAATQPSGGTIAAAHPDFEGRILGIKDFTGSDRNGTLTDSTSHGTHVMGSICGSGKASNGKYKGIAPGAKAYVGKVLTVNAQGEGTGLESWIIDGIQWAIDSHVDVINMSLGASQPNTGADLLCQAANAAADNGIVVCVAAGNSGPRSIGTPGAAERVLTVGSINLQEKLSGFSSTGPVEGVSYHKPDILAPGEDIISTLAPGFKYFYSHFGSSKPSLPPELQGFYTFKSGTSMATPTVSGIVALILNAYDEANGNQRQRSKELVAKIKEAIMSNAKDMGLGPDEEGRGIVQPAKAIAALISSKGRGAAQPSGEIGFTYEQLTQMLTAMNNNFQNLSVEAIRLDGQLRTLISQLLGNKESIDQITPQIRNLWDRYNQTTQPSTGTPLAAAETSSEKSPQDKSRSKHTKSKG
jgi:subtilisin family serine protease